MSNVDADPIYSIDPEPSVFVLRFVHNDTDLWDLAHVEHYLCNGTDTIAYCDNPGPRRWIGQGRATRGDDGHIPPVLSPVDMTRIAAQHYTDLADARMEPFTDEELDQAAFLAALGDPRQGYEQGLKALRDLRPQWCDYIVDQKWEWHG